jgi:hypothetical protein
VRRDQRTDERHVDESLARLWDQLPALDADEAHAAARAASGPPRDDRSTGGRGGASLAKRRRLGWTLAAAAAALLAGSGLGFGLGSSVTPRGNAGTTYAGFGFLPARGWTVVQSGTIGSTGTATAVAANVPLHPEDGLGSTPYATLESLPATGVLIHATFTTRGDAGEDFKYPVRRLPLDVAGAAPVPHASDPQLPRGVAKYRLVAGVGGHNIRAEIYTGASLPSARALAAAQRQLSRLVVAAERVTIRVRPAVAGGRDPLVTLFGTVDSSKADEVVDIQGRDCGQDVFTAVAAARTREGGGWSTEFQPFVTTTLRAVWNGTASAQTTVRVRAFIQLRRLPGSTGAFEVSITAKKQFWHRRVLLQRFDRRLGTWKLVRSVLLTEQIAAGNFVRTSARFKPRVPKGTLVRAVFPLSQASPCYLAGTSSTWRT